MPKVFIGIPTLNRPGYVRETISSVLAQTMGEFRVLVSDNASEAGVADDIAAWISGLRDDRVGFHRQPENLGEYGQGRLFMREATEDYFIILHDDDVLDPRYLERAVGCLESSPDSAYFIANPYFMDASGHRLAEMTSAYMTASGRRGRAEGEFDVRDRVFGAPTLGARIQRWKHPGPQHGFTPLCGTCFRTAALRASGFVDDDCSGNYPFEFNILLRLCDMGARAWYCPEELLGFRVHGGSMTNYIRITDNPLVVGTMVRLLERREYSGQPERRRRVLLARFRRALAMIRLGAGDEAACRAELGRAFRDDPLALKTLALLAPAIAAPKLLGAIRRRPPEALAGPRRSDEGGSSAPPRV